MAITLPTPGTGAAGRRGRAKVPTAFDVPTVRPPTDPGVNIAGMNVPAGAFGGAVGAAVEDVGGSITDFSEQLFKADDRIKTRQEALDRMRLHGEGRQQVRELLQAFSTSEDLSSGDTNDKGLTPAEAFGSQARALLNGVLSQHNGRDGSKARLEEMLGGVFNEFTDKAATLSVAAGNARTDAVAGDILSNLAGRALQGEDPNALINEGMTHIKPGSELAEAMRPGAEINFARLLNQRVVLGSIDRLFVGGDLDSVKVAMEDPAVQRALGTDEQRKVFARIAKVESDRQKIRTQDVKGIPRDIFEELTPGQQLEAVGATPDEKLVEIFDATSPTKTRFVRESEALGQPGRVRTPIVSITEQGETAMAKELGKRDAERVSALEDDAQTAFRTLAEVDRMQAATESGRFTTGVFSDFRVFLSRFADFVGASDETRELLGDAATADTLDAATNRLGVEAAQKLGRITNMSLQFVRDSLPNLARTPEGNIILMEVMRRTAEREIKLASLAEDFLQRHGTLRPSEGKTYFQAVRDLEEEDPVITDELRNRIVEGSKKGSKTFIEMFAEENDDILEKVITTKEEFDLLPPGEEFIWGPTGKKLRKPDADEGAVP